MENGVITYSVQDSPRPSGTIANHVCNDGFILVGVEERTCLDSGNFSDSPPTCERESHHSAFAILYIYIYSH